MIHEGAIYVCLFINAIHISRYNYSIVHDVNRNNMQRGALKFKIEILVLSTPPLPSELLQAPNLGDPLLNFTDVTDICACLLACVLSFVSCVQLFATFGSSLPNSSVHGFSRQENWNGLPCPPPGHFPDPGIEPVSPYIGRRVLYH